MHIKCYNSFGMKLKWTFIHLTWPSRFPFDTKPKLNLKKEICYEIFKEKSQNLLKNHQQGWSSVGSGATTQSTTQRRNNNNQTQFYMSFLQPHLLHLLL